MAIKPFITKENFCIHCGAKNSLIYKDLHGKDYNQLLYPIMFAECSKCKHIYFMKWTKDESSDEMIPFYDEENIIEDFSKDIIQYSKTHRRILK